MLGADGGDLLQELVVDAPHIVHRPLEQGLQGPLLGCLGVEETARAVERPVQADSMEILHTEDALLLSVPGPRQLAALELLEPAVEGKLDESVPDDLAQRSRLALVVAPASRDRHDGAVAVEGRQHLAEVGRGPLGTQEVNLTVHRRALSRLSAPLHGASV